MFGPQNTNTAPPLFLSAVRTVHILLFCYAAAIIGLTFSMPGYTTPGAEITLELLQRERTFGVFVAAPMMLGSFLCFFAATVRSLFVPALFVATFLSLSLASLPLMATMFFPISLVGLILAAVYAFSAIILARLWFSLPTSRKK